VKNLFGLSLKKETVVKSSFISLFHILADIKIMNWKSGFWIRRISVVHSIAGSIWIVYKGCSLFNSTHLPDTLIYRYPSVVLLTCAHLEGGMNRNWLSGILSATLGRGFQSSLSYKNNKKENKNFFQHLAEKYVVITSVNGNDFFNFFTTFYGLNLRRNFNPSVMIKLYRYRHKRI
jgi:hypothetical protein